DGIRDFHVTGVQTCALPIYRRQFVLRVDGPALVGFPVEVDGEAGDHGNRQLEVNQLAFDTTVSAVGDAPRQGQITVKPGRQQRRSEERGVGTARYRRGDA